ncbi:hypothetical protein HU200_061156 [Digitaria exilis]|uniref:Uncharacterized protein n=1 Tax=Digitaria exilis TaxID=1010633 RepID=A0A835AD23_9POAL|nr:hypothetical protein HU200_061156 [Digitaria exilis]
MQKQLVGIHLLLLLLHLLLHLLQLIWKEVTLNKAITMILVALVQIPLLHVLVAKRSQVHIMNTMKLNLLHPTKKGREKVKWEIALRIMWNSNGDGQAILWKLWKKRKSALKTLRSRSVLRKSGWHGWHNI